jgi:subtilisin family serine protease
MMIEFRRLLPAVSVWLIVLAALATLLVPPPGLAQTPDRARRASILQGVPRIILDRLAAGEPQEVIVEFDSAEVEAETRTMRSRRGLAHDDRHISEHKARRFLQIKDSALAQLSAADTEVIMDYSHLPMLVLRLHSAAALARLADLPQVSAVHENRTIHPHLGESLPLINQPEAASAGYQGDGTAAAVLDTGVNYALPDFGSCSAPGAPSGCKVVAAVEIAAEDGQLDSTGHGTNVAAIVLGEAPGAKIAALDVFNPDGSSTDSLVIQGINWAIANKWIYNIAVINMSLGDGSRRTGPCSSSNPYLTPVNNARAAGILPVASSGNNGFTDGINRPACTPGVISVGAVYDANIGGVSYGVCTDPTTAADRVSCFSNSASFLTVLAPGAAITAGGYTKYGTSQAAPHVAGAVAVLRAAYPSESIDTATSRLTASGKPVTDHRNNITKPRLDLYASLGIAQVPALSVNGLGVLVPALALLGFFAVRRRSGGK